MLRRIPTITALRALEATDRLGTVRLAAQELNITPSAVSHQIASLEQQVDAKLFARLGRTLALTNEGQRYLATVRPALLDLGEATRELKEKSRAGTLVIHTYPLFTQRWLIPRLHAFTKLHPDIPVQMVSSMSPLDFTRPEIDAAIVHHSEPIRGYRSHATIGSEMFPVCSKSYLAKAAPLEQLEDLLAHDLIQYSVVSGEWGRWLRSVGADIGPHLPERHAFDTRDLGVEAARHGLGVALALTPFVNAHLASRALVEPLGVRTRFAGHHSLVARDDTSLPPRFIAFRDWLALEFQGDAGSH